MNDIKGEQTAPPNSHMILRIEGVESPTNLHVTVGASHPLEVMIMLMSEVTKWRNGARGARFLHRSPPNEMHFFRVAVPGHLPACIVFVNWNKRTTVLFNYWLEEIR